MSQKHILKIIEKTFRVNQIEPQALPLKVGCSWSQPLEFLVEACTPVPFAFWSTRRRPGHTGATEQVGGGAGGAPGKDGTGVYPAWGRVPEGIQRADCQQDSH